MTILDDIYNQRYSHKKCNAITNVTDINNINTFFLLVFKNSMKKEINTKTRWKYYRSQIIDNTFINAETKEECISFYGSYIRILLRLYKILNKVRIKRYKSSVITTDLIGTVLTELSPYNKIDIYENCVVYTFSLHDIKNIINESLSYSPDNLLITPKHPKNPYTNMPLSNTSLYKIYLWLHQKRLISCLMDTYIKSNFNLDEVFYNNIMYLQRKTTRSYLINDITQESKFMKLIEIIFIFCGYVPNDSLVLSYFLCKENLIYATKTEIENELITCGFDILCNYYYNIIYDTNFVLDENKYLSVSIHKCIPLSKYFDKTFFDLEKRKRMVFDGTFLDYIIHFVKHPFLKRRHLSRIRKIIRRNKIMYERNTTNYEDR